jgi:hypothetical protein
MCGRGLLGESKQRVQPALQLVACGFSYIICRST